MKLAVAAERRPGERRVALVPDVVKKLIADGWDVGVQTGAGSGAWFFDDSYLAAGAVMAPDVASLYQGAAVLVRVNAPSAEEAAQVPHGVTILSFFAAASSLDALRVLSARGATVFSFDLIPRISRAQGMDALSSQATVIGYRAALAGAEHLAKFFPMFMTAAGTVAPAKVLVMGVGVAGLQAIATARRLGAVVSAYDVRTAAKEEAESLGATFIEPGVSGEGAGGYARELSEEELERQRQILAGVVASSDVVITTASVPGRTAPVLVTSDMVDRMGPGSVIIDAAADSGGNCELTKVGEEVVVDGTTIVGLANPASLMPTHASFLYSRNAANLLSLLGKEGQLAPDWDDEVVTGSCLMRDGEVLHLPSAGAAVTNGLLELFTVFVLAGFVGYEVISKVPSILHTPLMSGSNAIHGVILVGSMIVLGDSHTGAEEVLGFIAVLLATLNVVGGFTVTDRMLEMFKSKAPPSSSAQVDSKTVEVEGGDPHPEGPTSQ